MGVVILVGNTLATGYSHSGDRIRALEAYMVTRLLRTQENRLRVPARALRGGEVESRRNSWFVSQMAHNHQTVGSIPTPATPAKFIWVNASLVRMRDSVQFRVPALGFMLKLKLNALHRSRQAEEVSARVDQAQKSGMVLWSNVREVRLQ